MEHLLINPAAERMFGYTASELMGEHSERLIPERARNLHAEHLTRFTDTEEISNTMAPQMEITGLRSNGEEFLIASTISRSVIGGRLQMTAVLRDATDPRCTQRELQQVNKQLRQLTTSLQSVREQERKRPFQTPSGNGVSPVAPAVANYLISRGVRPISSHIHFFRRICHGDKTGTVILKKARKKARCFRIGLFLTP